MSSFWCTAQRVWQMYNLHNYQYDQDVVLSPPQVSLCCTLVVNTFPIFNLNNWWSVVCLTALPLSESCATFKDGDVKRANTFQSPFPIKVNMLCLPETYKFSSWSSTDCFISGQSLCTQMLSQEVSHLRSLIKASSSCCFV